MPRSEAIPVLEYPDVGEAARWLCDAFGFTLRLLIGAHRAQLNVGTGAVVLVEPSSGPGRPRSRRHGESVLVRVDDVARHHKRARRKGARILRPSADYPYGERQYSVEDLAGHVWTFSQTIKDVAPETWGGTLGEL